MNNSSFPKFNFSFVAFAFCALIIGLNFQNCGNLSSSDYGGNEGVSQGDGGSLDDIPTVDPGEDTGGNGGDVVGGISATFNQGDRFQGETLVASGSFIDTLISMYDYTTYDFSKAIAVAENGLGYMSMTDINDTQEAERMAMESCNLLTGMPCALIVSENTFVIDSDEIAENVDYILDGFRGQSFNKNRLPMASTKIRNSALIQNYINADVEKALALSITGGVYATYTYSYQLSEEEVRRMAVQQCELEAAISPCILYAVNDEVVFDPGEWVKRESLVFNNNNVLAVPPPASRDSARDAIEDLLDSLKDGEKYAVVVTPNGYGFFGKGNSKDAALNQAMGRCESGGHGARCLEYATSAGVTFSSDSMKAKANYGSLFCKVPRYSCANHNDVGCGGGTRWVQSSRSLAAERVTCGGN